MLLDHWVSDKITVLLTNNFDLAMQEQSNAAYHEGLACMEFKPSSEAVCKAQLEVAANDTVQPEVIPA